MTKLEKLYSIIENSRDVGVKLSQMQRSINIISMKDGMTKKVLIK